MKTSLHRCGILLLTSLISFTATAQKNKPDLPRLEKRGKATQLIVDGKPFLVLGGELHNSAATSMAHLKPIWPKLVAAHLNTVLAAVTWELTEPTEGKFDFSLVDGLLQEARQHNLRLSLLWFGSWKNGLSHYVPAWVKTDSKRFPRVQIRDGKHTETLSTLSAESRSADARAFAALMKHLNQADPQRTVIMVQVENEVGVLGDSRDRSPAANQAFAGPVPSALMTYLQQHKTGLLPELTARWATSGFKTAGTWEQVFGSGPKTDEVFMAWHYATYVNQVAEAGKAEYALPLYVNAWIVQPEDTGPGDYPTGGPQAQVHDIWRAGAPKIDLLTPDIYLSTFADVTQLYTRADNALFIPESKADSAGAANAFYAIGRHSAIGYSPFGIEDRITDFTNGPISRSYGILAQMAPAILKGQQEGTITGVWLQRSMPRQKVPLGDYVLDMTLRQNRRTLGQMPALGYGLVVAVGPDEYMVAGKDIQFTFSPTTPGPSMVGYTLLEEGTYQDGKWVAGRRLNGDDIMFNYNLAEEAANDRVGSVIRLGADGPTIRRVKIYRF